MTKKLMTFALTSLLILGVSHAQEEEGSAKKKARKGAKAQRASVEARFKKWDKNSDSKISLEEFSAVPAMKKAGEERAKEIFAKIDTTKDDGGLTVEELKAGRKHMSQKGARAAKGKEGKAGKRAKKKSE